MSTALAGGRPGPRQPSTARWLDIFVSPDKNIPGITGIQKLSSKLPTMSRDIIVHLGVSILRPRGAGTSKAPWKLQHHRSVQAVWGTPEALCKSAPSGKPGGPLPEQRPCPTAASTPRVLKLVAPADKLVQPVRRTPGKYLPFLSPKGERQCR